MVVTLDGIVKDVRLVHAKNARSLMLVTLVPISTVSGSFAHLYSFSSNIPASIIVYLVISSDQSYSCEVPFLNVIFVFGFPTGLECSMIHSLMCCGGSPKNTCVPMIFLCSVLSYLPFWQKLQVFSLVYE